MDDQPPPAYSEQELDQKIATALELSVRVSDNDSGDWEQWDEAVFNARAANLVNESLDAADSASEPIASGSSAGSRIDGKWSSVNLKPRPSWYEEANISQFSGPSGPSPSASSSSQPAPAIPLADGEDRSIPPPPFTPLGPSLDGPPFEEVEGELQNTLTFMGVPQPPTPPPISQPNPPSSGSDGASAPPSPLIPPSMLSLPIAELSHRRSLPYISQVEPQQTTSRPVTVAYAGTPRLEFRSSSAYSSMDPMQTMQSQKPGPVVDATAFYNSAVSQHLKPSITPYSKPRPSSSYSSPSVHSDSRQSYMPTTSAKPVYLPAVPASVPSQYAPYANPQYNWQPRQ